MLDRMILIGIISFLGGCVLVVFRIDGIIKTECDHYNKLYLENVEYVCVRTSK